MLSIVLWHFLKGKYAVLFTCWLQVGRQRNAFPPSRHVVTCKQAPIASWLTDWLFPPLICRWIQRRTSTIWQLLLRSEGFLCFCVLISEPCCLSAALDKLTAPFGCLPFSDTPIMWSNLLFLCVWTGDCIDLKDSYQNDIFLQVKAIRSQSLPIFFYYKNLSMHTEELKKLLIMLL